MNKDIYSKLANCLSAIETATTAGSMAVKDFNREAELQKAKLKTNLVNLYEIQNELQADLEMCYIEKGDIVLSRYVDVLIKRTHGSIKALLENVDNPSVLARYYNYRTQTLDLILLKLDSRAFYVECKAVSPDLEIKMTLSDIDVLILLCLGAIFDTLSLIRQKETDLLKKNSSTNENEEFEIPTIDSPRQKLILLHELGILKKLREEYNYLGATGLSRLLFLLLGIKEDNEIKRTNKIKNMSGDIDPLIHNRPTSGKGGYVMTKNSVKPVKAALSQIGVKIKNLPDFDE